MKWLLVIILAGTPIKTDWTFDSLTECLQFEEKVVAPHYKKAYAAALEDANLRPVEVAQQERALALSRLHRGTCIPIKS